MYISIDLGGSNTRVASTKDLKEILEIIKVQTEQNIDLERSIINSSIEKLVGDQEIKGVCLGVPGFVNKKERKFEKIVNVPSFSGFSFDEIIGNIVAPERILAENDASLAGLGESVLGAGKNFDVVAYLTLSTGVGGVRIAEKKIDPHQKFSEPGHMIIEENGRKCEFCGQNGCLCAYTSGTAFKEIYGMNPSECEDLKIWSEYAKKLSLGVINLIAEWAPDVVVLGGSISNKFEEFFKEPLMAELSKQDFFKIPPIVKSELGDNSGIYGGFVMLKQAGL